MAGDVKGITIEFRGDTTQLDKNLRKVADETKVIDKELKAVEKALKFNPGNVELLRQKYDLLNKKISETKKRLDILKQQQKQMDASGVDKNSEEYRKLQREIIKAESQLKEYNKEQQKIKFALSPLGKASAGFKKLGNSLTKAGQSMKQLSVAGAAVVATLSAMTYKAAENADTLNTLSKRYGISTKELQKYALTAGLVDVDLETVTKSHVKLEKSMYSAAQGSKTNAAYFEQLGVSIYDANGELRNSDDVFNDVIKSLGEMENETERDAIAMQLMGKSAAELNPLIEDGGKTYAETAELMNKYGLDFIDQETLDKANEFTDGIDRIKMMGTLAYQTLGAKLAEYLLPALEKVVDWVGRLANWLSNLDPRLLAIIGAVGGLVAAAAPLLIGLGKVATGLSAIINLIGIIGPAIGGVVAALGPVVLAIGAVIAIGVLLYKNWDTIKAKAQELWKKIKTVFAGIKSSITTTINNVKSFLSNAWNAIKNTASNVWNGVKNAITSPIQTAVNFVKNAIAKIKNFFPISVGKIIKNLKLPHFTITGSFSLVPPKMPKISVDWYKTGGIFDSPSLIGVGEAGAEAVVPLDTLWNKLDKIAAASAGGGGVVININTQPGQDSAAIAREVERVLVRLQQQRERAWA